MLHCRLRLLCESAFIFTDRIFSTDIFLDVCGLAHTFWLFRAFFAVTSSVCRALGRFGSAKRRPDMDYCPHYAVQIGGRAWDEVAAPVDGSAGCEIPFFCEALSELVERVGVFLASAKVAVRVCAWPWNMAKALDNNLVRMQTQPKVFAPTPPASQSRTRM